MKDFLFVEAVSGTPLSREEKNNAPLFNRRMRRSNLGISLIAAIALIILLLASWAFHSDSVVSSGLRLTVPLHPGYLDIVHPLEGDAAVLLPVIAPVDVIAANIISSVILELLPVMASALRPQGFAILAGILESEHGTVVSSLQSSGWELRNAHVEEDWWSALVQRR